MFASLSRLGMPGVNIVPRRGPVHERDHCSHCDPPHSLFSSSCSCSCSSSYTDESSSLPSSRPRTPFDSKGGRPVTAGSESRLELAHRAIAPSSRHPPPPRPARNPARIHKEAPTRNKLVSESGEGKVSVLCTAIHSDVLTVEHRLRSPDACKSSTSQPGSPHLPTHPRPGLFHTRLVPIPPNHPWGPFVFHHIATQPRKTPLLFSRPCLFCPFCPYS